jgi:hypothetical protein
VAVGLVDGILALLKSYVYTTSTKLPQLHQYVDVKVPKYISSTSDEENTYERNIFASFLIGNHYA